ncbi:hypothetical protein NLI96_g8853 [Meripilus lineatus]|uniref:Uncharacterized protein n=1 Tax=Meripilus lineatus TaxID=2056292 RepID=A0AAD5V183_9APHY|nr:hypothetical protein NLI96_g8853 [Physisporinus lineatus]
MGQSPEVSSRDSLTQQLQLLRQHSRPALYSEMAELLIYSWPYQTSSEVRSFSSKLVVTLAAGRVQATQGQEWFAAVVRKVIADRDTALQIVETVCRDIRSNDWIIDDPRFFFSVLVEMLVRHSSLVREAGVQHPKNNLIRSLAIAGQRQLCLGSENSQPSPTRDPEFLGIRKMLLTVM